MVQSLPLIPVNSWGGLTCDSPASSPTPSASCAHCYFYFCTNSDAELSCPLRCLERPPSRTSGQQRPIRRLDGGCGQPWSSGRVHTLRGEEPSLVWLFSLFHLSLGPSFPQASRKIKSSKVSSEPFCPHRSQLLRKYFPVETALPSQEEFW